MANEQEQPTMMGKCPACKVENTTLRSINGLYICDKCSQKRFSSKVRKSIQEAFERQQSQKQRDAWRQRIDVARRGVKHYEEGKLHDALRCFRDYITILEARNSISPGTLSVAHFDLKKDAGEILLIAGIYWDLAKIYDHMKGHQHEMRFALNKFIEFSVDRPHIILASEAIRKYLATKTAVNIEDFKRAHEVVRGHLQRCFIATAVYGSEAYEVGVLRGFRDEILSHSLTGRLFIAAYYSMSPPIARFLRNQPAVSVYLRKPLGALVQMAGRALHRKQMNLP